MPEQQENREAAARKELQAVVADREFADRVVVDAGLCESVLRDRCGECRREIALLASAVRAGVPRSLKAEQFATPIATLRARLVQKLVDEHALSETGAAWAVDSWMSALGRAPEQIRSQRTSVLGWVLFAAVFGGGLALWHFGWADHAASVDPAVVGSWSDREPTGTVEDALSCTLQIRSDGTYNMAPSCPPGRDFLAGKITMKDGHWEMRTSESRTLSGTYTLAGPFLSIASPTFVLRPMQLQRSYGDYIRH